MTGHAMFNRPLFNFIASYLRECGYEVINPAEYEENSFGDSNWEYYMRTSLCDIINENIVGIAVIEGWRESKGAKLEVLVATSLGIPVYKWVDWVA